MGEYYREPFSFTDEMTGPVYFLTSSETSACITRNEDGYYETFSEKDLYVRGVKSADEYIVNIRDAPSEWTPREKARLVKACKKADWNFKGIDGVYPWFDAHSASSLPWKIGCIKGRVYEYGLPHTRGDIILLSKEYMGGTDEELVTVMMHEKVHIYQKQYPRDTQTFLEQYGFQRMKRRTEFIHANPDVDEWIYVDAKGRTYEGKYNRERPNSFQDITYFPENKQEYEHPFEKMAILLESVRGKAIQGR